MPGHCYFANVFGPAQYKEPHDELAREVFRQAFAKDVYVGQLLTRLGIPGFEAEGPRQAAQALLEVISQADRPAR